MSLRTIAALFVAPLLLAPPPRATAQGATPTNQSTATTVVVPSGTLVPLNLGNPIKHKSTKPGDTVRAQVAFPITVGDQIAIPAGTAVEGTIAAPMKGKKPANAPPISIHFTRLIYANGYTVSLDATNTAALAIPALSQASDDVEIAQLDRPPLHGPSPEIDPEPMPAPEPQYPTPTAPTTSLPHLGPTTPEVVAITAGPIVAIATLIAVLHLSHTHADYVVEAAGWQFQMTLQNPLPVDVMRVNAAAVTPAP